MENNKELQELDDILSEMHDLVQDEVPDVEPDEELLGLLDLPEITVTPVVVRDPETQEPLSQDGSAEPESDPETVLEGDTCSFTPVA